MKRCLLLLIILINVGTALNAQKNKEKLSFKCSMLDENGTLWLGTNGAGLWKIQGSSVEPHSLIGHSPSSNIYSMTLDRQGHLWLTTDKGLMEFDYNQWKPRYWSADGPANAAKMSPVMQQNQHAIGISVNHLDHALLSVQDNSTKKRSLVYFDGSRYSELAGNFEADVVYEDLDAITWMGNGGYKLENGKFKSVIKLPMGLITCAMQDESGDVWLGIDGPGIYRYNGIELKYYSNDHGFNDLRVTSIHQDKNGKIWMATDNLKSDGDQGVSYFEAGLFHHLQDAVECPITSVNTIASDKKGNVWFAGDNGSLVRFNGRGFATIVIPATSVQ